MAKKKKKGLTNKQAEYTHKFLEEYPVEMSFRDRILKMSEKENLTESLLYRYARECDWKSRLENFQAEKENEADLRKLKLQGLNDRDISFTEVSDLLKACTNTSLRIAYRHLKQSEVMINYYLDKIDRIIAKAGDTRKLDKMDTIQIEHCEKKVNNYVDSLRHMITPTQLMSLMRSMGIKEELELLNDQKGDKLTPEYILQLMQSNGMKSMKEKGKKVDSLMAEFYGTKVDKVPDLDGRINRSIEDAEVVEDTQTNKESK